ncbi:glycosyltransferase family 2 protein [Methylobacterium sp. ap11]|uniref:glycosyltransferase family 2 protein n=1 Tax=Methylobacterium sp. ap11 TaxID=1761799 RepID=UPI0015A6F757|nr:glycosyltransferase family 2 protein [Methylobacterium sp. ap11]
MKYAAVCAHVKDEQDIIGEWIAFHIASGFEHVYIIDNGSSDNTRKIIQSYEQDGRVTYLFQPTGTPADFSTLFIKNYGEKYRWMAFIDADEFLYPSAGGDVRAALSQYEDVAGVGIYWQIYGSSGHNTKPEGLTIDNFTKRARPDYYLHRHVKSIVNPAKVIQPLGSHIFKLDGIFVDEQHRLLHDGPPHGYYDEMSPSHSILRINHYHVRSREQYDRKRKRGYFGVDDSKLQASDERFEHMWQAHDMNDEYDDSAKYYRNLVNFYMRK